MKKTYHTPHIKVMILDMESALLAYSGEVQAKPNEIMDAIDAIEEIQVDQLE